ncbi:MAG: hypothetical protein QGH42_11155 [Kiritimatiellia bacterium]|jgi:hypothetical protein|nr:hypothetical protein [Kiritimatiellia bacterium]MDP6631054.1 hypothetical protein [Kiritimatiellia bacterium]MDP6810010.1 hypothetical protein [Kiritimatiellia bacterium]MDP7024781.1 hypothetical protein [Kiritimatiellia bacterium]
MHFKRTVTPGLAKALRIYRLRRLALDTRNGSAVVDDKVYDASLGCWMFYLPGLTAKLFHARNGSIDCIHPSRPSDKIHTQSGIALGRYVSDEWNRALTTTITRRLAELWIVNARLWQAGLGPQPLGLCFIEAFQRDDEDLGPTCGFLTENVFKLRPKLRCRLEHVQASGVRPDKILSCIRQQVRGYIIDHCSVVGCVPEDAEAETAQLEALICTCRSDDALKQQLALSLTTDG